METIDNDRKHHAIPHGRVAHARSAVNQISSFYFLGDWGKRMCKEGGGGSRGIFGLGAEGWAPGAVDLTCFSRVVDL